MANVYDYTLIARTARRHGIKLPKALTDAQATHDAAVNLREQIAGQPRPDLTGLTAATLPDLHAALVDHATRAARLDAATELTGHAAQALDAAWIENAPTLAAKFGAIFNTATADFLAALDELEDNLDAEAAIANGRHDAHHRATTAAATMSDLAEVRTRMTSLLPSAGVFNAKIARLTHTIAVNPDNRADLITRVIPMRLGDHAHGSPEWWATLARIPGVTITWQTPSEQHDNLGQFAA